MQEIDIVIISNAYRDNLFRTTRQCVESLLASEPHTHFNIWIIESFSEARYNYPDTQVIYPEVPFGYHRYLNIGRKEGKAPYVCLCNNDILFERGWASEIIRVMEQDMAIMSASPFCPRSHPAYHLHRNSGHHIGFDIRRLIAGWCIFQQRAIYDIIGDLDEDFVFWYADNDYGESLKYHNIKHALVTGSVVKHMTSATLNSKNHTEKTHLTHGQKILFDTKWERIWSQKDK